MYRDVSPYCVDGRFGVTALCTPPDEVPARERLVLRSVERDCDLVTRPDVDTPVTASFIFGW